jgi:hypothetical protein
MSLALFAIVVQKKLARDKRSSLFNRNVGDKEKSDITLTPARHQRPLERRHQSFRPPSEKKNGN